MRLNGIAGKAMVVIAMALMGWASPTSAMVGDGVGCGQWACVPIMTGCDEEELEVYCLGMCFGMVPEMDGCDENICLDQGDTKIKCYYPS